MTGHDETTLALQQRNEWRERAERAETALRELTACWSRNEEVAMLLKERDALQAKYEKAEAACAAMRAGLDAAAAMRAAVVACLREYTRDRHETAAYNASAAAIADFDDATHAALATDAGTALLARLKTAEDDLANLRERDNGVITAAIVKLARILRGDDSETASDLPTMVTCIDVRVRRLESERDAARADRDALISARDRDLTGVWLANVATERDTARAELRQTTRVTESRIAAAERLAAAAAAAVYGTSLVREAQGQAFYRCCGTWEGKKHDCEMLAALAEYEAARAAMVKQ